MKTPLPLALCAVALGVAALAWAQPPTAPANGPSAAASASGAARAPEVPSSAASAPGAASTPTQPMARVKPPPLPPGAVAAALGPLVQRGEYLARMGDCVACHTAPGGKPFAGGLSMASPIGAIYSTNITPDPQTGIGHYSFEDFDRAVRHGIAKEGHTLYPAMPYTAYAHVRQDDVRALYAFFMQAVPPVVQANKAPDIRWPLSMRWPLAAWRGLFAPKVADDAPAVAQGDAVALGRYWVTGLGHCGTCHTPRGVAFQEKASTDADGSAFLSGAVLDGWVARNLRGDPADGLGSWSAQDIVDLLKGGRTVHAATVGSMSEVVEHSTQYLNETDLQAIAAYLKSLPPVNPGAPALAYNDTAAKAMFEGQATDVGARLFIDSCAACHRTSGKGYAEVFPALAQNATVNAKDPSTIIQVILHGSRMPGTRAAPTRFAMPGFATRLTNAEVAEVATFIRRTWGNSAPAVTADQVAKLRTSTQAAAPPAR